ncbi:hypothetical protein [Streptomyces botrytidirepellens]|uniref:Uncharacterized protein n=1 Tax=Streptomyces botrytidirepellens TaxID=2486417 RepID=A0A3M8WKX9_9ACTN|nr:hypothetical protein [Streptomyces botrytidirepellens]RNG30374.1 hypothetical protein EEJ42_10805 [Streptomyces botrytidirepellens]
MPESTLKYDPPTTEGEAVACLFRGIKNIEDPDGNWNGDDTVHLLRDWFTSLGINPSGPANQIDTTQLKITPPEADPGTVTDLLAALPGFTTERRLAGDEGHFYATYDEPGFDDRAEEEQGTIVVFPFASKARLRTAVTALRRAGYTATAHTLHTRGYAVHVHADVVCAPVPVPAVLPADVRASIATVVSQGWDDEQGDYEQRDTCDREGHLFVHMKLISDYLDFCFA